LISFLHKPLDRSELNPKAVPSVTLREKISENYFYSASNFPYAHGCELAFQPNSESAGSPQEEAVEIGNS
jgi:hypothetical protein